MTQTHDAATEPPDPPQTPNFVVLRVPSSTHSSCFQGILTSGPILQRRCGPTPSEQKSRHKFTRSSSRFHSSFSSVLPRPYIPRSEYLCSCLKELRVDFLLWRLRFNHMQACKLNLCIFGNFPSFYMWVAYSLLYNQSHRGE